MDQLNGRTYDGRDLRITIDAGRPGPDRGGFSRYNISIFSFKETASTRLVSEVNHTIGLRPYSVAKEN